MNVYVNLVCWAGVLAFMSKGIYVSLVKPGWRRFQARGRLLRHICGVCHDYIEIQEPAVINRHNDGFDHPDCVGS